MLLSAKTKRAKKFETFLRNLVEDIKSGKAGNLPERIYLQLAIDMNLIMGDMKSPEYDTVLKILKSARSPIGIMWPRTRLILFLANNKISSSNNPATVALRLGLAYTADGQFSNMSSRKLSKAHRDLEESMLDLYNYANSIGINADDHLPAIKISLTYETDVDFLGHGTGK